MVLGVIHLQRPQRGRGWVMKFWALLQIVANGFRGGGGYFSDSLSSAAIPIYSNVSQLINSAIKNVLFLVPREKVLELGFPQ